MSGESSKTLVRQIYLRWIAFGAVFAVISGITGSWLVGTQALFFPFWFAIYGSAGKVLLFAMFAFFLFSKSTLEKIPVQRVSFENAKWAIAGGLAILGFFGTASQLFHYQSAVQAPVLTFLSHLFLVASTACAAVAVFGEHYLFEVFQKCQKMLLLCFGLAVSFYFLFGAIFKLWPYLSSVVLWAVVRMLKLTIDQVVVRPPLTIQLPQFSVTVGEYCSGIESLFLGTVLYIGLGILERSRIKKTQFALLYLPLICGQFLLNIVRVYLIILSGLFFSPQIAAKLFHTYLGILFFIGYFSLFIKLAQSYIFIPTKKDVI